MLLPSFEDQIEPQEKDERDQHCKGKVRVISAGGMHNQARVGGPQVDPDGHKEADYESPFGHAYPLPAPCRGAEAQGSKGERALG